MVSSVRARWSGMVVALMLVMPVVSARAQTTTGSVTGSVGDASGRAIPGATVRVVNEATHASAEAVTNEQGTYRFDALAPGQYRLDATLEGFDPTARRLQVDAGQTTAIDVTLTPARFAQSVVVTARRVEEVAQEVPIPVSVVSGELVADAGAFNVNRLKEMIPTVQFYSTNPRNSAINIRGLGAPFGLTNDGIEPGVGLYIDGVFYARPASATLDFLDVDRVEVLRGPQGTLFGKNTTAGAINVTTRKPSFTPADRLRAELRQPRIRAGEGLGHRPARREGRRTAVVLRHAARRHGLQRQDAGRRERSEQPGRPRPGAVRAVGQARDHASPSITRASGPRATRRSSPASRRRCAPPTGSTRRSPPTSATRRRASTPSIALTDVDTPLRSYQDLGGASLNVDWKRRPRPADLDDRLALLGLEPVERPRLHRPAGHDDLGGAVEAAAVDAGSPLRRRPVAAR